MECNLITRVWTSITWNLHKTQWSISQALSYIWLLPVYSGELFVHLGERTERRKSLGTRDKIHRGQNHAKRLTAVFFCFVQWDWARTAELVIVTISAFFSEQWASFLPKMFRPSVVLWQMVPTVTPVSVFRFFFSKLSKSLENSTTYFWCTLKVWNRAV